MSTWLVIAAIVSTGAAAGLTFSWLWRMRPVRAPVGPGPLQEVTIVVNGRYRPDRIVVQRGIPVRLNFVRNEDNPCSEWVVFSAFNVRRRLAAFRTTTVNFVPSRDGEFFFTCQLGVYRGKLVVKNGHRDRPSVEGPRQ